MNPLTNVRNIGKLNDQDLRNGIFDHNLSWHAQYKDSAYIFIGGLPYDLTEGDVLAVFSQYGEIVNIHLVRDKKTGKFKGYGFLCYEDQRSTILAVDNFNGIKLGGRTIRVDHVTDYRRPKSDKKDESGKYIEKVEESCAPKALPIESESENEGRKVKKKKNKKKKKKKKKREEKEVCSSSEDGKRSAVKIMDKENNIHSRDESDSRGRFIKKESSIRIDVRDCSGFHSVEDDQRGGGKRVKRRSRSLSTSRRVRSSPSRNRDFHSKENTVRRRSRSSSRSRYSNEKHNRNKAHRRREESRSRSITPQRNNKY